MEYRLYLYESQHKICAAESFAADGGEEALEVGAVLYPLMHDSFQHHEVWCGTRHLTARGKQRQAPPALAQSLSRSHTDVRPAGSAASGDASHHLRPLPYPVCANTYQITILTHCHMAVWQ